MIIIFHTAGCLNEFFAKSWFSRFSSMQKQHVKVKKHHSSRALPSRPQSENVKLRSLPSTPAISSARPSSSLLNVMSPPGGHLGPLQEILTMENDTTPSDTYDTADGCVLSKTTDKRSPPIDDGPLEYASTSMMRHLVNNEHKFRSLPCLPTRTPPGDGIYSVASGDRSPDLSKASLYSSVGDRSSPSSHQRPMASSSENIYSTVDKSAKTSKPSDKQMESPAQSQDIYSTVDKSTKRDKFSDQQLSPVGDQSQGITHKPVVKKRPMRSPLQSAMDMYGVDKKSPSTVQGGPEAVYSEITKPVNSAPQISRQQSSPVQSPQQEQLYSVVNKPPVKEKPKRTAPEDIYSVVNKPPPVKLRPTKQHSDFNITATSASSSEFESTPIRPSKLTSADLYAEVKPKQIENGDIYSVVSKPTKPPPVAKKPVRQNNRILLDSSVTMTTSMQEDVNSEDEDEPTIPDRCYDDDELGLDDEPPELPPRLYSLSDFESEDELCFDDLMDDLTFENPIYQSTAECRPIVHGEEQKPEEFNPLYQTLASIRKEMDDGKPKTGTLKVSKCHCHAYHVIFLF